MKRRSLLSTLRHELPVTMLAMLAMAGCSFAMVKSTHGSPPECTESIEVPVIDTLIAIAAPFVVYWVVKSGDDPNTQPSDRDRADGIITAFVASPFVVGYGISALWGYATTSRCRRIKALSAPPPPPFAPGSPL
jgi:hypothetical protein